MSDYLGWAAAVLTAFVLAPLFAYYCARAATAGFYRGRSLSRKLKYPRTRTDPTNQKSEVNDGRPT